jgi:prophage regulatory protein
MPDQPDRFLRLNQVFDRAGLSRSTVYRKVEAGSFPRQVTISTRCVGWRETAVTDWMRSPMFYQADEHADG